MKSFMDLVGPQVSEEPKIDVQDAAKKELLEIPRRFAKGDRVVCNVGGRYGWIAGTIQANPFDSQTSNLSLKQTSTREQWHGMRETGIRFYACYRLG